MSKLYLECNSGISGDMTVAALLDLGADAKVLENEIATLPLHGFKTEVTRVKKAGLDMCDFNVILEEEFHNHDHDMDFLYGENDEHHKHRHHHHEHRGIKEIYEIIDNSGISVGAKITAKKIFEILGQAEAKAHGTTLEEVHFHEVGAVDSIVDIVAVAICLENLGIKEVVIPVIYEGCGTVNCQHGVLPVPVPAVANIVSAQGLNLHFTKMEAELITPTGAAIAAAIKTSDELPESFSIEKIGMGAGKRKYKNPSILRAMLINEKSREGIYKLESNIDDCTGEALGYCMERLLKAGARDVNFMPVFMKKNRPAYQINVVCSGEDVEKLEKIIFEETTTIGIRRIKVERSTLTREIKTFMTSLGEAKIKVCELNGEKRFYPEYDSVTEICREHGKSFQEVYKLIERECSE